MARAKVWAMVAVAIAFIAICVNAGKITRGDGPNAKSNFARSSHRKFGAQKPLCYITMSIELVHAILSLHHQLRNIL